MSVILRKIDINWDLNEAGIQKVMADLYDQEDITLYTSVSLLDEGMKLSKKFGIKFFIEDELPKEAWFIKSKYYGIFSPGA